MQVKVQTNAVAHYEHRVLHTLKMCNGYTINVEVGSNLAIKV